MTRTGKTYAAIFTFCSLAITGVMIKNSVAAELKRYDEGTQSCRILRFESSLFGKGQKLFNQRCKSCHTRKNDQNASFIHTETLPPNGWNRVFYKKNTECAKSGEWKGLSKEDQLLLNDYLWRYGANTYDPYDAERCG